MIKKAILTYKCGCQWTVEYAMGATKREIKVEQEFAKRKDCPKCYKEESA